MDAIKAYRVKGGAVVRVFRGDRVRRYRVTGRRFRALQLRFAGTLGWHGYFGRSTIDIHNAVYPSKTSDTRMRAVAQPIEG